jgi:hypothetical protein
LDTTDLEEMMGWFSQRPEQPTAAQLPQEPPDPAAIRAQRQAEAEAVRQQWVAWYTTELLPRINAVLAAQDHTNYKVGAFSVMGSRDAARVVRVDGSWDWVLLLLEVLQPYAGGYTLSLWGMWRSGGYRAARPSLEREQLTASMEAMLSFRRSHPGGYFAVRISC